MVKDITMCLEASEAQKVLQKLALYMVITNKSEIEYDLLSEKVAEGIRDVDNSVDVETFIQQIVDVSELLVKKDENYEFAHLSFQGYLASKEIIKTKQDQLLIENWHQPWWKETILLYSAQINPNNLLRQLIQIATKDSITLALRCIEETPKKIEDEVENELTVLTKKLNIILFTDLEAYLKNKQWQKADEETNRLMLQLGDKDEKGYLSYDDCHNFPKEELRTIDRLWLKYSNNHFGISIQKQIYLEYNQNLDYDIDSFRGMSNKIGWKNREGYISYREYIFSTDAPSGHLPSLRDFRKVVGWDWVWFSLVD